MGTPGAHLEEPRNQIRGQSLQRPRVRHLRLASPALLPGSTFELTHDCRSPPLPARLSCSALRLRFEPASVTIHRTPATGSPAIVRQDLLTCQSTRLAPSDRPFSLTFLPDYQVPGCLPPLALSSASSSALASAYAADPSFRFELPTRAECRLSSSSIRSTLALASINLPVLPSNLPTG